MKRAFICENCNGVTTLKTWIFRCVWCDKEICDTCMHGNGACKECAVGKMKEELEAKFEEVLG